MDYHLIFIQNLNIMRNLKIEKEHYSYSVSRFCELVEQINRKESYLEHEQNDFNNGVINRGMGKFPLFEELYNSEIEDLITCHRYLKEMIKNIINEDRNSGRFDKKPPNCVE